MHHTSVLRSALLLRCTNQLVCNLLHLLNVAAAAGYGLSCFCRLPTPPLRFSIRPERRRVTQGLGQCRCTCCCCWRRWLVWGCLGLDMSLVTVRPLQQHVHKLLKDAGFRTCTLAVRRCTAVQPNAAAPASRAGRYNPAGYLGHCRACHRLVPIIVSVFIVVLFVIVQVIVTVELRLLSAHGCSIAVAG